MPTDARPGVGRPRDPDVDRRLLKAALAVYGESGWAGFNFDVVARQAGVGRPALYRRWPEKRALLLDALIAGAFEIEPIDTGRLRDDLVELACRLIESYSGPLGAALLRLYVEARSFPDLFAEVVDRVHGARIRQARAVVRRGLHRGELTAGTSTVLVLDAIHGGVLSHVLTGAVGGFPRPADPPERFAERLVDLVLYSAPGRPDGSDRLGGAGGLESSGGSEGLDRSNGPGGSGRDGEPRWLDEPG